MFTVKLKNHIWEDFPRTDNSLSKCHKCLIFNFLVTYALTNCYNIVLNQWFGHCSLSLLSLFASRLTCLISNCNSYIIIIAHKSNGWLSVQCLPVCHLVLGDSWSNVWPTWTSESGWLGGVLQFVDFQRKIMGWFELLLLIEEILWNNVGGFRVVVRVIHVQITQK